MYLKKTVSPLREKSFALAVRIVKLHKYLVVEKKEFTLSKQILKSGTSPGANIREAFNGKSDADFIHKLSISQKETDETLYWLELLFATDYISETAFKSLYSDTEELLKIIRTSILTKRRKIQK